MTRHGDTGAGGAVPWVWSGRRRLTLPALLRSPAVDVHFVPPPSLAGATDPQRSLRAALAHPLETPRLSELARGARTAAIAVPDSSRALPVDAIVPALLDELAVAGVSGPQVTVIVGCGAHRATTAEERRRLAGGPAVTASGVRLRDAQAQTPPHRALGRTRLGCPIRLCEDVAGADLAISVGIVEPHLYAGFSGGVKGVAIGCAAEETIAWTHAPAFISRSGVELLSLAGNPFQDTLREIAAATGLRYAVNAAGAAPSAWSRIAAGRPEAVQEALARHLTPACLHEVERPFDVVVAGIPTPKHESLYQASRAATYLGVSAHSPVKDGGLIVLCAELPGGFGDGPGERRFAELLASSAPDELVARGLRGPLGPGGQRAFVVARVLRRCRLAVAGAADPELLSEVGIGGFAGLDHALDAALPATSAGASPSRVLVLADALSSVVRLRQPDGPPGGDLRARG
ncbi:MAG: DUF2088 domain-containing protein [Actinobacteria bacterium]|nr:DUF2088 domain-containing protein [Actinomycetota bacterium]